MDTNYISLSVSCMCPEPDAGHDADGGVSSDGGGEAMAQLAGLERNAAFAADRQTRCGIGGGDG